MSGSTQALHRLVAQLAQVEAAVIPMADRT
jgi:hypothetical protein